MVKKRRPDKTITKVKIPSWALTRKSAHRGTSLRPNLNPNPKTKRTKRLQKMTSSTQPLKSRNKRKTKTHKQPPRW